MPKIAALCAEARLGFGVGATGCEVLAEEITGAALEHPGVLIDVVRPKTRDEYTFVHGVAVGA